MVRGNIKLENPERFSGDYRISEEKLQATIDKVESASDKSSYQSKLDSELAKK